MTEPHIVHFASVSSTQDAARELILGETGAKEEPCPIGTVIVADVQEKGRGRRGREWMSPRGGLYASIIMENDPLLPLRVGVGVTRALQDIGIDALLKWPNDVIVRERKIGGILIEALLERAIVGIGVNIEQAPLPAATCICEERKEAISRDELLRSILCNIKMAYCGDIVDEYRALCSTIGRDVTVTVGNETMMGNVVGVDQSGCLVLKMGDEIRIIHSGECNHIETLSVWRDPADVLG